MSSVRNVCVYRLGYWMEPISWRFTKLNFVWTTYFRLCRWLLRVCTLIYYLFILLGSFFSLLLSVLCVFFSLFFLLLVFFLRKPWQQQNCIFTWNIPSTILLPTAWKFINVMSLQRFPNNQTEDTEPYYELFHAFSTWFCHSFGFFLDTVSFECLTD